MKKPSLKTIALISLLSVVPSLSSANTVPQEDLTGISSTTKASRDNVARINLLNQVPELDKECNKESKHPNQSLGYLNSKKIACKQLREDRSKEIKHSILDEAIYELTHIQVFRSTKRVELGILSGTIFDHPKFEKYFTIIESNWEKLPENHHDKKTLHLLRLMRSSWERTSKEGIPIGQIIWKRTNGINTFMVGYTHTKRDKKRNLELIEYTRYAGAFGIEGYADIQIGKTLTKRYAHGKDINRRSGLQILVNEAVKLNPKIIIFEIDPRDISHVLTEENYFGGNFLKLDPNFYEKWHSYLKTYFPDKVNKFFQNPIQLLKTVEKLSLTIGGLRTRRHELSNNGILYSPFPSLDENGETKHQTTGNYIGTHRFSDAMVGLKLRKMAIAMSKGKLNIDGPIINFRGSWHTQGESYFYDHPIEALSTVSMHPHLINQHLVSSKFTSFKKSAYRDVDRNMMKKLGPKKRQQEWVKFQIENSRIKNPERIKVLQEAFNYRVSENTDFGKFGKINFDPYEIYFLQYNKKGKPITYKIDWDDLN